jgi:transposase
MGLLNAGDPRGQALATWQAKELVRDLALEFVQRLGNDRQDPEPPEEARGLVRTLLRWKHQIASWHEAHVTNAPSEAANNVIQFVQEHGFWLHKLSELPIKVVALRWKA